MGCFFMSLYRSLFSSYVRQLGMFVLLSLCIDVFRSLDSSLVSCFSSVFLYGFIYFVMYAFRSAVRAFALSVGSFNVFVC